MLLEKLRLTDQDLQELNPLDLYFRLQGRMTQEDFAQAMGVSDRTFRRWLKQGCADGVAYRRAADLCQQWRKRPGWIQ